MVRKPEFRIPTNLLRGCILAFLLITCHLSLAISLRAQQAQAQSGQPIYAVNAKYVQGVGPGYWPTKGTGLALNIAAGTAICGNPPTKVDYAGGTLAMTNGATNYIYLDPAASCAPASNTTGFTAGVIPLAQVVAAGGAITGLTDVRTWFVDPNASGPVIRADLMPGADAGAKIQAAHDALPASGGTIDAWGLEGAQTISSTVHISKPIVLLLGEAIFTVQAALNITNMQHGSITIRGGGWSSPDANAKGTIFKAETGGVLFDLTGSQYVTLENFTVVAGTSTPSTVGLLAARSTTVPYCQFNTLRNVTINLGVDATANGGKGRVTIYNNAAEHFRVENGFFLADNPLVITGHNDFGISSTFVTHDTTHNSSSEMTFTGPIALEVGSAGIGYPLYVEGSQDLDFEQVYMVIWGTPVQAFSAKLVDVKSLTLKGHSEYCTRVATVKGYLNESSIQLTGLSLSATDSQFYLDTADTGLYRNKIAIHAQSDAPAALLSSVDTSCWARSNLVFLQGDQTLGLQSSQLAANLLIGDSVGINADPGSAYIPTRMGIGAAPSTSRVLNVSGLFTNPSSYPAGTVESFRVAATSGPNSNSAYGLYGVNGINSTNTQDWTSGIGITAVGGRFLVDAGATGTVYKAQSFRAEADVAAGAVTEFAGFRATAPTGAGSITAKYSFKGESGAGIAQVADGLKVSDSGTTITKHLSGTASLDFDLSGAGITCQDLTITVTGAAEGNTVSLGIPNALASSSGVVFSAWVSAANTVTVRACDVTSANPNPAAAPVRADVWQH